MSNQFSEHNAAFGMPARCAPASGREARTQRGKRHGGAHREAQLRHALMQQIQDRRRLRDMAETVAGDGDDEVGHGVMNSHYNYPESFLLSSQKLKLQKIDVYM